MRGPTRAGAHSLGQARDPDGHAARQPALPVPDGSPGSTRLVARSRERSKSEAIGVGKELQENVVTETVLLLHTKHSARASEN